jgi:hypothetical protein
MELTMKVIFVIPINKIAIEMKNKTDLIYLATRYTEVKKDSIDRKKEWIDNGKADFVKSTLQNIATDLKVNIDFFNSNIFIEEFKTGNNARGFSFKAGGINLAENGIVEKGFKIDFFPTYNWKILIIASGHHLKDEEPKVKQLAYVEFLSSLTEEFIIDKLWEGISFAQETSFLFN